MNLAELLGQRARESGSTPAIVDVHAGRDRVMTFGELELAARRGAALLHRSGLQPGDGVLVLHSMSAELYTALVSIFQCGLKAVFLDPSAGRDHIENCCALHPPAALIASAKAHLLRLISPALRRIPIKFSVGSAVPGAVSWARLAKLSPRSEIFAASDETPALLTFTSGSTGRPKAALRTHGFLTAQYDVLRECLQLAPGDIDLATLPIFALANLAGGVTSLIPDANLRSPAKINARAVLAQIRTHQPTRITAAPAFLERLLHFCTENNHSLPSVKSIFTGGAPVFPRLLRSLVDLAPRAAISAVYGSTEAEPIAHLHAEDISAEDHQAMLHGHGLLAGYPVPRITLRVLPDRWGEPIGPYQEPDFAALCRPPVTSGEIVVSGKHVLPGYLHGQGDEETKFTVNGVPWHRTGDAGYLDNSGRLWLLGPCGARITDPHGTLYPFSVECAAHHTAGIQRAALIQHHGRRLLAVETSGPIDLEALRGQLGWAHIASIRRLDRLPVDQRHNGKVDYARLGRIL